MWAEYGIYLKLNTLMFRYTIVNCFYNMSEKCLWPMQYDKSCEILLLSQMMFNDILGKHLTQLEIELKWLQCFIRVTFIYV